VNPSTQSVIKQFFRTPIDSYVYVTYKNSQVSLRFHLLPVDLCNGLRQVAKLLLLLALMALVVQHYHCLTQNELHANVDVWKWNLSEFSGTSRSNMFSSLLWTLEASWWLGNGRQSWKLKNKCMAPSVWYQYS